MTLARARPFGQNYAFVAVAAVFIALMAAAFCATFFFKVNVIYSILAAAVIGAGKAVVLARRAKGAGK